MKFGDIVITTEPQDVNPKWGTRGIPAVPVGTKCVVVQKVDLPAYDLLVVPEGYTIKVHDLESGAEQDFHTLYLYRGSWKAEKRA